MVSSPLYGPGPELYLTTGIVRLMRTPLSETLNSLNMKLSLSTASGAIPPGNKKGETKWSQKAPASVPEAQQPVPLRPALDHRCVVADSLVSEVQRQSRPTDLLPW